MSSNVEEKPRQFKEVSLVVTQSQPGSSRFPISQQNATFKPPSLSRWRNNLTGLSKVYNFYFVAYMDAIHVYQPGFPTQSVSNKPDFILNPPISSPGLQGHIDGLCPHSINHLLVDFLGNEEIVVVCCDDGDVIAYHTSAVRTAIERRQDPEQEFVDNDPRPFFHENVRDSAWGLSVHKEARMIAVSANTCKVTVFALALASNESPSDSSSDEPEYPVELESLPLDAVEDDPQDFPTPRSKSNRITLDGLSENIPSVAFCNTGDDPIGRWVLATDIGGTSCLLDIHQRRAVRHFRTGFCCDRVSAEISSCSCEGGPYAHSGWGVMWLDRRSFRRTKTWSETGGLSSNFALADQADLPLRAIRKSQSPYQIRIELLYYVGGYKVRCSQNSVGGKAESGAPKPCQGSDALFP